jgi:hypothetical protein
LLTISVRTIEMSSNLLRSIQIINSERILYSDLPEEQNILGQLWSKESKSSLLSSKGVFSNYWVITKTTTSSSKYELYCGENVDWSSCSITQVPEMIYVIENNKFKGILIGKTITDLIAFGASGIYQWIQPIKSEPIAYIMAGDKMIGVAPGTRMHHIDHRTGKISEIHVGSSSAPFPNMLPGIVNISSFQRVDTIANARSPQDQIMQLMNTPGISLGAIGRNLGNIRFG